MSESSRRTEVPIRKGRVFIFNLGIYFAKILMYLLNFSLIYEEIIRFCQNLGYSVAYPRIPLAPPLVANYGLFSFRGFTRAALTTIYDLIWRRGTCLRFLSSVRALYVNTKRLIVFCVYVHILYGVKYGIPCPIKCTSGPCQAFPLLSFLFTHTVTIVQRAVHRLGC